MTVLPPGLHLKPPQHGGPRLCVLLQGSGTARPGTQAVGLGPLDALYSPAPGSEDIVNAAKSPLHVLWVDEAAGA